MKPTLSNSSVGLSGQQPVASGSGTYASVPPGSGSSLTQLIGPEASVTAGLQSKVANISHSVVSDPPEAEKLQSYGTDVTGDFNEQPNMSSTYSNTWL